MQQSITAFIVDDEFQSRNFLAKLITRNFPSLHLLGQASNVTEAFISISDLKPSLVFLDIMMQEENAFELLEKFDNIDFEIIFCTAHNEFAIRAFKFNALDYLLKPIDPDEFNGAVLKAINKIKQQHTTSVQQIQNLIADIKSPARKIEKIAVPSADGFILVALDDILYCQGNGNYTEFHLANSRKMISSYTLKQYDEILGGQSFFRAHKSFLVNLSHVVMYRKGEGGTIVMSDGREVEISRRNKDAFIKIFKG